MFVNRCFHCEFSNVREKLTIISRYSGYSAHSVHFIFRYLIFSFIIGKTPVSISKNVYGHIYIFGIFMPLHCYMTKKALLLEALL